MLLASFLLFLVDLGFSEDSEDFESLALVVLVFFTGTSLSSLSFVENFRTLELRTRF